MCCNIMQTAQILSKCHCVVNRGVFRAALSESGGQLRFFHSLSYSFEVRHSFYLTMTTINSGQLLLLISLGRLLYFLRQLLCTAYFMYFIENLVEFR